MNIHQCPTNTRRSIFCKMGNTEIVRMRRTCSGINAFIEENKEKLSSRANIGLDLSVVIDRKQPDKIVVAHGNTVLDYGNDLASVLSAVAISHLDLHIKVNSTMIEEVDDDVTRDLSEKLFEFLKTVKIPCDVLQFHDFSARVAVQVADYVSPRKNTYFNYSGLLASKYLHIISKDKNCSTFYMSCRVVLGRRGLFEKAKQIKFLFASHFCYAAFREFIWDICRSPDHGNFSAVHTILDPACENNKEFDFDDPQHPMPAFRTIWDKATVPQELYKNHKIPETIRIFNQAGHVIVYVEKCINEKSVVMVNITRNDEEFLHHFTNEFSGMNIALPENFTTSTEEEQVISFRNAFMAAINSVAI